ncbi:lipoxygenase family protein [Melittangium boletus]|uniref:lipoxygenase family protein n=1 Tax=Melittangium boletus TaxID=83453 RepID=UPI003DA68F4C
MTVTYKIKIRTGARAGAGTDGDISVVLVGAKGESESHALDKRFYNDFEAGAEDVYDIKSRELGELLALRFSNEAGVTGDWFLDFVVVSLADRHWRFPHYRWVLRNSTVEVLEGTARLPQHETEPRLAEARRAQLHERQELYTWRPAGATAGLPGAMEISARRPLPKDELYRGLSQGGSESVIAKTMASLRTNMPLLGKAWNGLVDTLGLFKGQDKPRVAPRWQDDHEFARQAVQGVSPLHITSITALPEGLPLSDPEVRGLLSPGSTLAQALAAQRVFLLDFEILDDIPMFRRVDKEGVEERRWAPPARCLLYLEDSRKLRPLAIQLGRDPATAPVFTPNDPAQDWLAAKLYLRCSEGNTHQLVSHALRTHLVVEPFVVASLRNLSDRHPVYKLMRRHFRYTLAINEGTRKSLLDAGGVFDEFIATGGPDKGHLKLGQKGYGRWTLLDNKPRVDLARRGVLAPSILPDYPYRDDALPLWDALEAFVSDILARFYKSSAELLQDTEMQAWWKDLTTHGLPVDKLPCAELTRVADLVDILTTVLFTGSVHHAAVNSLQYEHYAFVPNAPLCMRQPPPTKKGVLQAADFAEMIPTRAQTLWQVAMGRALASFGEDEEFLLSEGGWRETYFHEPEFLAIRERFHTRLRGQLAAVKLLNATREVPYTVLQPDRIPCGITA